ncbi:O-acetyltransferase OatA [Photorhabdus australis subsp. thailandensis]|uniref:O-acetyltransferase OatA n=1 Tax=Photorhabdus australis subsp. thailandensis TaxID=2805096 RepID=A0A1C0U1A3_9GAMM|nr:acyltransferase [Photorhabdus australis]OCQ51694.1 O-acetyltransferase OatA [Photorhabdus australis subsp. thailandensis]
MNSNKLIKNTEIHTLSFLRGISALYVMLAHILIWGGYKGYFPNPKVAVDVFIFISGFLIASRLDSQKTHLGTFYLKRFFRIAPAYYFTIAIIVLVYPLMRDGLIFIQSLDREHWPVGGIYDSATVKYNLYNIVMHLSFIFGLSPTFSQYSYIGDWSISLEMQFYLIAPFIFYFFKRKSAIVIISLLSIIISIIAKETAPALGFREQSLLIYKIHIFMLGAVTYEYLKTYGLNKYILLATAMGIIATQFWIQRYNLISNNSSMYLILTLTLMSIKNKTDDIFNNFLVSFLSQISYSLYLIHGIFIALSGYIYSINHNNLSDKVPLLYFIAIITIPLSISCAYVMSKYIEKNGIYFCKMLIQKKSQITL